MLISFATVFTFFASAFAVFAAVFFFLLLLADALWKLNFPVTFFSQSSKLSAKNYGSEE